MKQSSKLAVLLFTAFAVQRCSQGQESTRPRVGVALSGGAGLILRNPSVRRPMRSPGFAAWYEAGRFDAGSAEWQTHQSTSAGVFVPTPLGAAGMTLSVDESGRARFRILIGSF